MSAQDGQRELLREMKRDQAMNDDHFREFFLTAQGRLEGGVGRIRPDRRRPRRPKELIVAHRRSLLGTTAPPRIEPCRIHVEHHPAMIAPPKPRSDSVAIGITPPRPDSFAIGQGYGLHSTAISGMVCDESGVP